ncbi:hypothetical protein SKAU_G00230620 [Synaphobranchus kaupii]|uniref:Uncharacterized protein n=1 Tax=Synaphobranchus kaupii TaxID=118154 RepID=A0A9Q1F5K8_SYNKA|nr:hypothetical protein SKAU_G00230620 [Synaphobranchus kaupii]
MGTKYYGKIQREPPPPLPFPLRQTRLSAGLSGKPWRLLQETPGQSEMEGSDKRRQTPVISPSPDVAHFTPAPPQASAVTGRGEKNDNYSCSPDIRDGVEASPVRPRSRASSVHKPRPMAGNQLFED